MKTIWTKFKTLVKKNKLITAFVILVSLHLLTVHFFDEPLFDFIFGLFGETGLMVGNIILLIVFAIGMLYALVKTVFAFRNWLRDRKNGGMPPMPK